MRKLKSLLILFAITLTISMTMNSCMVTKTSVGQYTETRGDDYTYARGKQMWLFWGIIPLGRTNVNTPADGNCQVITKYTFGDFLITGLTGGILTSYSIKVKAKK
ncbi:MAG: hypothetical protein PHI42_06355 [Paludibacteraceae bacterium]|nr:hypothetical protein [Paludibacteraceae bacterium]